MDIFNNILGIIAVLICFSFIIFIHELGHFLMARRVGVTVQEFALGMGPIIVSRKKGDTLYSLRAFPFGGFCAMEGEDGNDTGSPEDPGNFNNKTYWQRIKVIAAGPIMNYISAILIFIFVGMTFGIGEMYIKPKIGKVMENTPAMSVGLKSGDYIKSIDGEVVTDAMTMIDKIHASLGKTLTLNVLRDGKEFTVKVAPIPLKKDGEEPKIGIIGFQPDTKSMDLRFTKSSPTAVITDTFTKTVKFSVAPFIALSMVCNGKMSAKDVAEGSAGPVGIGQMFFEMYKKGFAALLYFIAIINILIGVFNLIPFPALDGARIAVLAFSGITGKAVDPQKEGVVHWVGFCILILAVLFFTYNDIARIIKGVSFF